jgi:hypothetical protein
LHPPSTLLPSQFHELIILVPTRYRGCGCTLVMYCSSVQKNHNHMSSLITKKVKNKSNHPNCIVTHCSASGVLQDLFLGLDHGCKNRNYPKDTDQSQATLGMASWKPLPLRSRPIPKCPPHLRHRQVQQGSDRVQSQVFRLGPRTVHQYGRRPSPNQFRRPKGSASRYKLKQTNKQAIRIGKEEREIYIYIYVNILKYMLRKGHAPWGQATKS